MMAGSLRDLVPDDHVLARVDRVLDLSGLRAEVRDCYAADGAGHPGIDPEVAVRFMLAGLLLGIVHDRRLLREAQVNLAIRWFAGYGLHAARPDHSSLTRIRQRWPALGWRAVPCRVRPHRGACVAGGIAKGEVVPSGSALIRADVSWDAIARRHVGAVAAANAPKAPDRSTGDGGAVAATKPKTSSACTTDPDASLTKNSQAHRREPSYKHHAAVDAERAIRRGLANMQIQAYLTAAVVNLKRLATALAALLTPLLALVAALVNQLAAALVRRPPARRLRTAQARSQHSPAPAQSRPGFFNRPPL